MKKVKKTAKTTKTKTVKRTRTTKHDHATFYGLEHEFIIITGGSFVIVAVMFMLFT